MRAKCVLAMLAVSVLSSAVQADEAKSSLADVEIINSFTPSLATAEIALQPDNGEEPYGAGWGSRCPNCGQIHSSSVNSYVEQERPLELVAFVVADDLVIMPDPLLHERFIKSISVRQGDAVVDAKVERVYVDQRAVLLKLANKLPAAKPLVFDVPKDAQDLKAIVHAQANGYWNTTVTAFSPTITQTSAGPRINTVAKDSLLVTPDGKAAGLVFSQSLSPDGAWKGSPLEWNSRSVDEQRALAEQIASGAANGVVRVHLGFRSPKAAGNEGRRMSFRGDDSDSTERHVHGLVVAPNRVLVLANLKPDATARLERITVYGADPAGVKGKFVCSIKDYAALVVETEAAMLKVVEFSSAKPDSLVGPALSMVEVRLQGESRTSYISRTRLSGLDLGWRRNLFPELPLSGQVGNNAFLFDDEGRLIAFPALVRPQPKGEDRYRSDSPTLTFASQFSSLIADPLAAADANNVPLSEEEEGRIAWLGAELQQLTPDLARLNGVSQLTNDGGSGGLVTFVYPGSPAAKAGIEVGAVLLRVHVPGQSRPIDIRADEFAFAEREFPWQHFDEFPEAYFDQMPVPWPSAATELAKTLTEIGFGKQVELEIFQGGASKKLPLEIVQSPSHYDTAKRSAHAPSGLTVKTMTFELRRYFQVKDDAPGVVISRIEQGSSASRAGLKPYEYITHVNGKPVATAEAFDEEAGKADGELRLDVVRMNKARVVKVKTAAGAPAATPATIPAIQTQADAEPAAEPQP